MSERGRAPRPPEGGRRAHKRNRACLRSSSAIATDKTGTTTIQDTLFHNRQLLAAHGVVYPRIGLMAPHHTLATHWIDLPAQFRARRPAAASWATLARAYAGSDKTVLISSEEFSRQQPVPVDFRELRGFVEGFGRKRIACAFRNELGYLQSIYVQVTKSQAFVDFDYFFGQCMRWRYATGLALDYNVLLDQILAGFGRDEVILIPYERAIAEDGLVASFCRKLGLPVEKPRRSSRCPRATATSRRQRWRPGSPTRRRPPGSPPRGRSRSPGRCSSGRSARARGPRSTPAARRRGSGAPSWRRTAASRFAAARSIPTSR